MRRFPGLLLLALAACGEEQGVRVDKPEAAAPREAPSTGAAATSRLDEAELVRLEHRYAKALINKDRAFLMNFYASNWRGGNWTGFWTKSRMIGSLMDERYVVKSMEVHDVRVRIMGNLAIVQGIDDEVTSVNGRDTSGRWAFTDVFERRDGRWVAIASHTSQMKPEPD